MEELKQSVTVAQAAAMCGVNRNTVGLWIRSKKLHAVRKGRNYSIPTSELLFFLKSNRREIPAELAGETSPGPHFRPIQKCWDYFQNGKYLNGCNDCAVYRNRLDVCFIGKDAAATVCSGKCGECRYFQETFLPRIQLVHQIKTPAAVYKDFYLWYGNRKWARAIGMEQRDLIGLGIERVFHKESLGTVMARFKKRALGDPAIPWNDNVFVMNDRVEKIAMAIAVYPMTEPVGGWLLLGEVGPGAD